MKYCVNIVFLITFVGRPSTIGDKVYLYKQKNNQNL